MALGATCVGTEGSRALWCVSAQASNTRALSPKAKKLLCTARTLQVEDIMAGFCYTDKSRILDSAAAKSNAKERAAKTTLPRLACKSVARDANMPRPFRPG